MNKCLSLIVFIFLAFFFVQDGQAQVGFDAATNASSTGTSRNWVHSGGGSGVTAIVVEGGNLDITSVTYNAESLLLINQLNAALFQYGLSASTTNLIASGTVIVNSANDAFTGGSITFTGTATGTSIASFVGATSSLANANVNSYSISLTTASSSSMNVDLLTKGNDNDVTVSGTGQTERFVASYGSGALDGQGSTQPAATVGSYTMSGDWTTATNRRALMAEIFAPPGVAAAAGEIRHGRRFILTL